MFGMHLAPGRDPQQHLIGSCTLVELPGCSDDRDELREAAFWVYLRQDTQMAEKHRRRTIIDLDTCFMRDFDDQEPKTDDGWANRMVWIYARVVNYCFGSQEGRSNARWAALSAQVTQWHALVPGSFTPLFYRDPDPEGSPFPAIWFLCEWHGESLRLMMRISVQSRGSSKIGC